VPAAVLLLAVAGGLYATTTPRYALYRLGAAMQRHDLAEAERYFDVERIADTAADVIAADYLSRHPAPTTEAEANGRQFLTTLIKRRVRPQLVARVRAEIRRGVERADGPAAPMTLPSGMIAVLRAFRITGQDGETWVSYQDSHEGSIRFRMSRQPGQPWRISEFDPEWVRRRVREQPIRIR
jgi:Protein of unknown function (DUF2939)